MKRITLRLLRILLFAFFFFPAGIIFAESLDEDLARYAAAEFFSPSSQSSRIRANGQQLTLRSQGHENGYYIFDRPEGGVVFVADDDAIGHIVLGYTDSGSYDSENLPLGLQDWLHQVSVLMDAVHEGRIPQRNGIRKAGSVVVDALIQTKWDQYGPYNNLCPMLNGNRCPTGCVATAMAQVMKYWKWPNHGYLSVSYFDEGCGQELGSDLSSNYYDWDNMLNTYQGNNYTETQANAISTLLRDCGYVAHTEYTLSESLAGNPWMVCNVTGQGPMTWSDMCNYFHYSTESETLHAEDYSSEQWEEIIQQNLTSGCPVLYAGGDGDTETSSHFFIIDGYDTQNYYHVNWGWGGNLDGWFMLTNLNGFNTDQLMINNLKPDYSEDNFSYTLTLDGTLTINGTGDTPDYPYVFSYFSPYNGYPFAPWLKECGRIQKVVIGEGITGLGDNIFKDFTKLNSVSFPNSLTRIGEYVFCNSGFSSITIPGNVISIGEAAFRASKLTSIIIQNGVKSIGIGAFTGSYLESITIPNSVTSIGHHAFASCGNLTSATIGSGVTNIPACAFAYCFNLSSIIIPESVTSIDEEAFLLCYQSLTSITIPKSVTSIGDLAFGDCHLLRDVWCCAEDVPITSSDTFEGSHIESATLHVPAASLEAYSTTAPWSGFGRIVAIESPYRYYNLVITGIKGEGNGTIQFSEFDLLDASLNEVEALNVYAGTNGNEGEGWANVADNDVHTKYCSDFNGNIYFLFDATSQINPCGYRFYTANDNDLFPGRNPSSWKLYGSNTKLTDPADPNWVLLDQQNDNMVMQDVCYTPFDFYYGDVPNLLTLNKESIKLTAGDELQLQASDRLHNIQNLTLQWNSSNEAVASVSNQGLVIANSPGTANITVTAAEDNTLRASCTVRVVSTLPGHRYYQFAIEAIGGGDCIQLSEFDLIDINGNEVTPLTTYAHTGNSFSGEEQDNLFDDNKWTKYCGNFTAGTTLYIFIDAGKRVSLSGYRMTTAADTNTYPERNPISWSLLGSDTKSSRPDDVAWTLLDHRENDNTLDAYSFESYDFFFTYQPNYAVNDETKSLSITTEESECIVEFTHNFNGDWEALYLPFAIDYDAIKADFDLAEIDGVVQNDDNNDGTPDITVLSIMGFKGQTTTPNKPYLIRAKKTGKQTIVFDDVTVYSTAEASIDCSSTSTKYEFTGSYKSLSSTALKNRYIVQDGELVKGASKLSPCRWYMTATARNGAQLNLPNKIRIMPVEDVITGVSPLGETEEGTVIYNLAGQRLQKMQRGINIIGGKKVLR